MNFYAKLARCQSKRNLTEFPAAAAVAVCVCFASTHVFGGVGEVWRKSGWGKARRAVVAPLGKDFAWLAKRKRRCCFMRKVTNTANTPRSTETTTIYRVYARTHSHSH